MSPFITGHGNAIAFPMALSKAAPLCQNPLAYALDLVKKAKDQMGAEKVSSLADLMVLKGRLMCRTEGNYLTGETTHVGFYEVDFGWGRSYIWMACWDTFC
ncbi:hypothetical protein VNO80_09129 [Phaseolus coccineus]|uniref:Uncharacterized protein n=1 Tax=Phaseolus coccineus TaxID=3886 RepID=A0AAN9N5R7_PHACN